MGRAKPDVRPPGAAIPSAKSISIAEIPLAAMAVGLQPYSERCLAGGAAQKATQYERYKHRRRRPLDGRALWRSAHFLLFVGLALCPDRKVLA